MLLLKMLRDIKRNLSQFIVIFIMAFMATFVFSGISAEWYGIEKTISEYTTKSNFADIYLYGDNFTKDDLNNIKNISGVTEVERRVYLQGIGDFDNNPTISLYFLENNSINKPQVVEGKDFNTNDDENIWIDKNFAKAKNLKVGDTISVSSNGVTIKNKVAGIVESPEYIYYSNDEDLWPDYSKIGYAFLSINSFPNKDMAPYTSLLVKTTRTDSDKLEDEIKQVLNNKKVTIILKDNLPSYKAILNEVEQHQVMGSLFPLVFILIAILAMLTTMTRLVNNQRTQIGTLKALGFSKRKILFHYLSYGFYLSLVGSLLGALTGPMVIPYLFYPSMSSFYSLPEWKSSIAPITWIVTILSILLCTCATYLSCKNLLKDCAAKTLRPKSPKKTKRSFIEKTKLWNKLDFNIQWNLRDISRAKIRSIMGFFGAMSCMTLLVCAFSENDSVDYMKKWIYSEINQYETQLNFKDNTSISDKESICNDVNGQLFMSTAIEVKNGDSKTVGKVTVIENDNLYKVMDKKLNYINLNYNEIALSSRMANNLGLKKGDTIKWRLYGENNWIESTIDVINRIPIGQGLTMTKSTYEKLGYTYNATSIITTEKIAKYNNDNIATIFSIKDLSDSWDKSMEAMNIMVYVLIIAAISLALVVLYNLGLLSFAEREKELATLKVIGFKAKKIRKLLLTQSLWLSILGIIVGIPIGLELLYIICTTSGEDFDFAIKLSPLSIIISTAITLGVSILVNLLFSKKIKNIDMVESLKGVE